MGDAPLKAGRRVIADWRGLSLKAVTAGPAAPGLATSSSRSSAVARASPSWSQAWAALDGVGRRALVIAGLAGPDICAASFDAGAEWRKDLRWT